MRVFGRPLPPAAGGTVEILRLLPRVSAPRAALLGAGVVLQAGLPIAFTVLLGWMVGAVPDAVAGGAGSPAADRALALLALAAVAGVAARALGPFHTALANVLARRIDRHLQERLMAAVARPSGIAHLEDPETLDLIRNAQGVGVDRLQPGRAVAALATLLPSWLQAFGSAMVLAAFSPWLALVWVVLWPAVLVVLMREFLQGGQAGYGQVAAVRRSEYLRDLALAPAAAKEVRVWAMTDWLLQRFDAAWLSAIEPVWRTRRPWRPALWASGGAVAAVNVVAYALLAWAAIRGDIALAALAVYAQALLEANSFRTSDDANAHLAYAAVSVPALLALERRLAEDREQRGAGPLPPGAPRRAIHFASVSFRYPGRDDDVLRGLDLEIPAGQSLAIVGANGAGKTTLVKLLCGLYAPTAGAIAVDGIDLRAVAPAAWQQTVAAIFQDFVQYHLSARENLALGAPDLGADAAALRAAAERAGALDLIEALPRGWDTVLSRQYTDGVDLSGGQWQRIALARALVAVAGGARVLVLDEPTANLDVRAEAALYDRFLDITAGRTTILISHRFSTVRRADRIVVLDGGRVAEDGTHDELVARGGRYATMFALQAARFAEDGETAAAAVEG